MRFYTLSLALLYFPPIPSIYSPRIYFLLLRHCVHIPFTKNGFFTPPLVLFYFPPILSFIISSACACILYPWYYRTFLLFPHLSATHMFLRQVPSHCIDIPLTKNGCARIPSLHHYRYRTFPLFSDLSPLLSVHSFITPSIYIFYTISLHRNRFCVCACLRRRCIPSFSLFPHLSPLLFLSLSFTYVPAVLARCADKKQRGREATRHSLSRERPALAACGVEKSEETRGSCHRPASLPLCRPAEQGRRRSGYTLSSERHAVPARCV